MFFDMLFAIGIKRGRGGICLFFESNSNKKTASASKETTLEEQISKEFDLSLNSSDLHIERVEQINKSMFSVRTASQSISSFMNIMQEENPDLLLQFTEDLQNFEPDSALINKSKVPLWVVSQSTPNNYMIKRIW